MATKTNTALKAISKTPSAPATSADFQMKLSYDEYVDVVDSALNVTDGGAVTATVNLRGYSATTPSFSQKFPAHTVQTAGALTVTIAMITSGLVIMDPTADRAFTLSTAALAVAGVPGCAVGDCIDFAIINIGTEGADEIVTLAAGTGGTLIGSGAVLTSDPVNDAFSGGSGLFRLRFANVTASSEAIVVYRLA